ncbi:MAG: ABC transporter permease [Atopobiaceae bacterium]|nr:ABC transporter permease [Atopobiaceae bacterium]
MVPKTIKRVTTNLKRNSFLFEQLVNRDFQQRYKRTALGMAWSVLSPLMNLAVMMLVFSRLFGRNVDHFVIYLFSGNIVMAYYKESTKNGMQSLMNNSAIISKINVPKYLFLLSRNVSALINFGLTIIIYFLFCITDGITFTPAMLMLWYPIFWFVVMNIGIGMVLSALYVFFRDIQYLYDIFLTLLTYLSAIFYTIDKFPEQMQRFFLLNPVYVNIKYWRLVVIDGIIPSVPYHLLVAFYALLFLGLGAFFYKKYNHRFVYYF